jgi:hypothetical protein
MCAVLQQRIQNAWQTLAFNSKETQFRTQHHLRHMNYTLWKPNSQPNDSEVVTFYGFPKYCPVSQQTRSDGSVPQNLNYWVCNLYMSPYITIYPLL